jgi:inosine triphosphate pyrophosphatase
MNNKQNIIFITGNKNKLKEVIEILGDNFAIINIDADLPEIQSTDVKEVIQEKIKEADKIFRNKDTLKKIKEEFKKLNIVINDYNDVTIICEDTGLHIDSMNISEKAEKNPTKMFPGALIKFYLQALGAKGIIEMNKNSNARLSCYIGVIKNGNIIDPIESVVEGKIANTFEDGGFGFDPCFIPSLDITNLENKKYEGLSYGQLPITIKNEISHRAVAFNKLKKMLLDNYQSRRVKPKKVMKGGSDIFEYKYFKYYEKLINN